MIREIYTKDQTIVISIFYPIIKDQFELLILPSLFLDRINYSLY